MRARQWMLLTALAGGLVTGLACAERNGPMEKAGRAVDKAAAKTVKAVGKATEKTGEALEKAGDKIQEKAGGSGQSETK